MFSIVASSKAVSKFSKPIIMAAVKLPT